MPTFCYTPPVVVYTVGHSTRPLSDFVDLLKAHGITAVADVRRFPASRRHPHFAREALAQSLPESGITYTWHPDLGGHRKPRPDSPHIAWESDAFRGYADHVDTEGFETALTDLLELARQRPTAIMCAEAVPWRCHRQLIANTLTARGIEVRNVIDKSPPATHRLPPFARVEGTRVLYDVGQLALPTLR